MARATERLWRLGLQRPRRTSGHHLFCLRSSQIRALTADLLKSNRLKQVFIEDRRPAMGFWQMLPGSNVSRVLASSGADWVMVDCEHGNIDDSTMHEAVPAIAALGVSPVVRIPDRQPWMVKRECPRRPWHNTIKMTSPARTNAPEGALDSGAHGILVPLIRTAKEVEDLVTASKFPPRGRRGFGSPIALQNFHPAPTFTEYLQQANDSLLIMVQIETREALDAVEQIAALVDVVFIGPFDLGNNIGHPIIDGKRDPELDDAIWRILKAALAAGKKCGIFCTDGEQAKQYAEMGFHMISVATDYTALRAAMVESLAVAQGQVPQDKVASY
ncbi:Pyruvate/Phosphoenolpyruvate kinase-like domain-containing protein [Lasiosphaeris hirsuta]|uniref:Pyruvate/Phosphoenolpyruvate kinase-like domain-containing protein n=1 Tax=Lasiosphaeris hirsuta TaxID=260670 RepID=A0AA40BA37_9PEZI|nr:Pyruvate/Phosphoenolpyruvate kinase-like domain-containing protein [Lasiosphaeris hirsuta]